MRHLLRNLGGAALALALASNAAATPADFTNTKDRDVNFSILFDADGVFAQDAGATLLPIPAGGTLTFDVPNDSVVFAIAGADWADSLIAVFGESPDPVTCGSGAPNPDCTTEGVIPASVTDYNAHFVLSTGASDPAFPTNWQAAVVFNLPIGPGVLLPLLLNGRDTDFAAVAAQGGDWFFLDPTTALAVSCAEADAPPVPPDGCDPADFRNSQPYDPATGLFTFLAVIDNGFIDPTFTPQGGAICETPANGGADFDCDGIDDVDDPCTVWYNGDLTDSNGDGIPNDCQCADTGGGPPGEGVLQSADAFGIAGCVVNPVDCALEISLSEADNNGLFQSADAFAVATQVVTGSATAFTLTCARRPEGTPPP